MLFINQILILNTKIYVEKIYTNNEMYSNKFLSGIDNI
jgi:hypothetical protein